MERVRRGPSPGELRVRTGCITCIARRVECDERKPTCLRCETGGIACRGYPANSSRIDPRESRARQHRQASYPVANSPQSMSLALRPGLPTTPESPSQANLLYHFRTSTLPDLLASSTRSDFWRLYAVPLGNNIQPVKYALCALGGLHHSFKLQYGNTGAEAEREVDQNVIQQYNQAIAHLQSFMADEAQANMVVVLVCCVIFICIEILQGRYPEALRHLQAGSKLLASLNATQGTGSNTTANNSRRVGPDIINHVSAILRNLAQDISFYVGGEIIPDLTCQDLETVVVRHPITPFSSPSEAEASFRIIQKMDNAVRHHSQKKSPPPGERPTRPPAGEKRGPPPKPDAREQVLWDIVNSSMHDWVTHFEIFKGRVDKSTLSKMELYKLHHLSVHQALWRLLMEASGPGNPMSTDDAEDILVRIEILLNLITSDQQAVFTFNAELIPTVYLVFIACPDLAMKQRCISLLRGMKRKEGVWDSQEIAEILERAIVAQGKGLIRFDDMPMEVPRLAQKLSTMKVSKSAKQALPEGILNFKR